MVSSPLPEPAGPDAREHLTYRQVYDRAVQYAAWMRSRGIRLGDRVAIGGANQTGWIVACIATLLMGAVPIMLNCTLYV